MATAAIDAERAPPAGHWRGDDFPSWMSPMLVKELRQGLQSGGFVWTFLVFQSALWLIFSVQVLLADATGGPISWFAPVFWLVAAAGTVALAPIRGLGAVSGERRGNGLDLLQITRLSAARIVVGKWVALFAQSVLLVVTLLPYVVIRYFFGGVDVLTDLWGLGWLLAAAALAAAVAIALSTLPMWLRIGVGIFLVGPGLFLAGAAVAVVSPGGPGGTVFVAGFIPWELQAGLLAVLAVYSIASLQFAAARIAPLSENHALRQRLLALVVAAAWPVAGWLGSFEAAVTTFLATAPLLVATIVGAVVERPSRVRPLFAAFRRAGVAGRLAAAIFAPGWASGIVFLAIVAATCMAGWCGFLGRFFGADASNTGFAFGALVLATIASPLPFTALLPRVRYPLLLYVLVLISSTVVIAFANAFKPYDVPWGQFGLGHLVTLPLPMAALLSLAACGPAFWADLASASTVASVAAIGVGLAVVGRPWLGELAAGGRLVRGDAPVAPRQSRRRVAAAPAPRRLAAAGRAWRWRGDDFPGWLSPMLVRELRQGVQSGIFAWTFIFIQGAMFALMFWAVGTFGGMPSGIHARDFAGMFWGAVAAAVAVIVPLRGLTAVSDERVASNLDLVRLTRLSATQIVAGKWAALVGQGLLVASALLPYLVLRYFFGGVNVVVDLELFGWMVLGSMAVAAAAIALSTLPLWARFGVVVVVAVVGFVPAGELIDKVVMGRLTFAMLGVGGRLGLLAGAVVFSLAAVEYAASRIAPPAENHAGRMRLIALGLAAAWAVAGVVGSEEAFICMLLAAGPLLLCYAIGALLEQSVPIAALYRPFGRWGAAGRLAAAVFTPGWATAVPFVALVSGLCATGWLGFFARIIRWGVEPAGSWANAVMFACLVPVAVLFPLPVLVRCPRLRPRLVLYALIQLACFLVFVFLVVVTPRLKTWADWNGWVYTLPFPLAALPAWMCMETAPRTAAVPVFLAAAGLITLVMLGLVARPWLAEISRVVQLTRDGGRRLADRVE